MKQNRHLRLGFPIAEIDAEGGCTITKEPGTGGIVNTETVISQLLYEISGPNYYNSAVDAKLEDMKAEQVGQDRGLVTGIRGGPPPPTTRMGLTAHGGYQAEFHFTLCGLDLEEKTQWMEDQIRYNMGEEMIKRFSMLKFHRHGTCPDNPATQELGTVDFRIFAQCKDPEIFNLTLPNGFNRKILETVLGSVPVSSFASDMTRPSTDPNRALLVTTTHDKLRQNHILSILSR